MSKIIKILLLILKLTTKIIKNLFFIPIILILTIINFFFKFNFIIISSERIGPFITYTFGLLLFKKLNKNKKIFAFNNSLICNKELFSLFEKRIKIYSANIIIRSFLESLKFWKSSLLEPNGKYGFFLTPNLWDKKNNLIIEARNELRNLLKNDLVNFKNFFPVKNFNLDKYICIHNRDENYLKNLISANIEKHHSYRNFDISELHSSINNFIKKGYSVIRVGSEIKKKSDLKDIKFFDYPACKDRSEGLDLFVLANCRAYFGSDSGIGDVPYTFGKPKFMINFLPTILNITTFYVESPITLSLLKDDSSGKLIKFENVFKNYSFISSSLEFKKRGLSVVKNSQDEIYNFSNEVLAYLDKNFELNKEDKKIQDKFWELFFNNIDKSKIGKFRPIISPYFLKKYNHLIFN